MWSTAVMVKILKGTSARMLCLRHPERKNALEGASMVIRILHRNDWYGRCREHTDLCWSSETKGEGLRFDVPVTSTKRGAFLPRLRSDISCANGI